MITVNYYSIDGVRKTRQFPTIGLARTWAKYWVGNPEIGSSYAVSSDGVAKVTCSGCTLFELFAQQDWRREMSMED